MKGKFSDKKNIVLSISALVLILIVAAGITFSWIEGGSTFVIKSNNNLKTGSTIPNYYDGVTLDPTSGNSINLKNYFDKNTGDAQDLIFAPAYSADGENFYFPEDENDYTPRKATTNDRGTKFINFSFKSKATKACCLALNDLSITATKNGETISDTSAFRIMIKCSKSSGTTRRFLTTAKSLMSSTVYDSSGTNNTLTAFPAEFYFYKTDNPNSTNPLSEYENASDEITIEISVWLDAEKAQSDLLGSEVEIDMSLKPYQKQYGVTFDAVTYTNTGEPTVSSFTGGKIKVTASDSTTETISANKTFSYTSGETVKATATANTNYVFDGWYSDSDCTTEISKSATLSEEVTDDITYYAKFTEKPKYTISVVAKAKESSGTTLTDGVGGAVYVNTSDTTSYDGYKDSKVTISATANSGYRFDGWYTNSGCTTTIGSTYQTAQQQVTISQIKTYYAKFVKRYTITLKSVTGTSISGTGGDSQIDDETPGASVSKTVDVGTSVTLNGIANSGYEFKGIYTTRTGSKKVTSPVPVTKDITYYPRFAVKSTYTVMFTDNYGWGTVDCYYWKDGSSTAPISWPGKKMTYSYTNDYRQKVYTIEVSKTYNRIIFNNGSNAKQTVNITLTGDTKYYITGTQSDGKYTVGTW